MEVSQLSARHFVFLLLSLCLFAASCTETEEIVVHRSSCLVCHRPMQTSGQGHGLEEAHPGVSLTCTECHGGDAWICDGTKHEGETPMDDPTCDGKWVYDKELAHVSPGDGPSYLKNLGVLELDEIDPAYLRFINPGDLRVLDETCGKCHEEITEMCRRSTMTHASGELTVARYRAEAQAKPHGIYAPMTLVDPNPDPDNLCASQSFDAFIPPPLDPTSEEPDTALSVANAQDQYMVKSCMRCHLSDFGENRFSGDFRSSGCTACHMPYSDTGLSESLDPRVSKETVPHPIQHEMTKAIPLNACTHCHYRGGRLGISYQGYRESAGPGLNPPNPEVLGEALHGHDANYYLTDEDTTNDFDETPPDVHFEAGMHCIDCHTRTEMHGDGHLYADTQCTVQTECTDCHGTAKSRATIDPERDNFFERDGLFYLKTKVTNLELYVPQVKDAITPSSPFYNVSAAEAMGNEKHMGELECYTCHAGWLPSCYGCHVTLDMTREKRYQNTGESIAGHPSGTRQWVALNDLILIRNTDGLIAPSMPAERFTMTVLDKDEEAKDESGVIPKKTIMDRKPRTFTFDDGRTIAGFGQRAFNPHTTRRVSQFMACDRCHSVGDPNAPDNATLLDITHGFGSERFPLKACDVTNDDDSCDPETDHRLYQLDQIQTRDGKPLVVIGHPEPNVSRVLSLEEIEAMRAITVPKDAAISTEISPGAISDPTWPRASNLK